MFKKNILYKSINLEVFKNFLGCLTILFILVASSRLLGYFDKSIAGNLESDLILSILILRSPEFINLLIPLSFFLSVLIALGRLYMDHEIYAYQSAGYSKMAFVKSLLFQTLSLTVISFFLSFLCTGFSVFAVFPVSQNFQAEPTLFLKCTHQNIPTCNLFFIPNGSLEPHFRLHHRFPFLHPKFVVLT